MSPPQRHVLTVLLVVRRKYLFMRTGKNRLFLGDGSKGEPIEMTLSCKHVIGVTMYPSVLSGNYEVPAQWPCPLCPEVADKRAGLYLDGQAIPALRCVS